MSKHEEPEERRRYASSPCSLHEQDPSHTGLPDENEPERLARMAPWRKEERERQIAARLALSLEQRRAHGASIATRLEETLGGFEGVILGGYWPMRGEPDLRGFMQRVSERGGRCALPVVVEPRRPLEFRIWTPGLALERGVWNIPVPPAGSQVVMPTVVLAPVVAFDRACYRLGYGGGYFDRTLAAMPAWPRVFGVGYSQALIATIHPLPHDVPMDAVVTESGVFLPQTGAPETAS